MRGAPGTSFWVWEIHHLNIWSFCVEKGGLSSMWTMMFSLQSLLFQKKKHNQAKKLHGLGFQRESVCFCSSFHTPTIKMWKTKSSCPQIQIRPFSTLWIPASTSPDHITAHILADISDQSYLVTLELKKKKEALSKLHVCFRRVFFFPFKKIKASRPRYCEHWFASELCKLLIASLSAATKPATWLNLFAHLIWDNFYFIPWHRRQRYDLLWCVTAAVPMCSTPYLPWAATSSSSKRQQD